MVREILLQNQNPEQAMEIYTPRWTPLHRAAAKGNLDIVRNLMSVSADMCFYYDIYGRTPLHVASIRGKVDVLKEMARVRPEAALETMENGDTILHLCARSNNWEALKGMMEVFGDDGNLFNSKNDDGNTILHIAAIQKQNETVEFLLHHPSVDVNIRNHKGLTALDILSAEKETPIDDYAFAGGEIPHLSISISDATNMTNPTTLKKNTENEDGRCEDNNWVRKKRNALMVVASLLATMAFQAVVNPPGGFWQQDSAPSPSGNYFYDYLIGSSVIDIISPFYYELYMVFNTIGFISSLSIILLLVSGLPIRRRLFMWILMIIMWIAISSMTMSFLCAICSITLSTNVFHIVFGSLFFWMGLMALLVIAHIIRLLVRFGAIKRLGKIITKMMRKWKQ